MKKRKKVLVVLGGLSREREVSLKSGRACIKAIKKLGHYVKTLDPKKIDYVFLGAWNFKKEIFNKEKKFLRSGGKFITHIPKPKILGL